MTEQQTKNDGTDPKKNDDSSNEVMATVCTCYMRIVNNSGGTIESVSLTHKSGSRTHQINMPIMNNGGVSYQIQINYETGVWADFDYWNISFRESDDVYNTPYNDRCNIAYEDAGKVIDCVITRDGSYYNLETRMPQSSNCNFVIEKN